MANKKTSRRALLLSAVSLILCLVMLTGTTFAWFTDNETSGINTIQSGNLDLEVQYSHDGDTWTDLDKATDLFDATALWEPGHTRVVALKITNVGSLAIKYDVAASIVKETGSTNVYGDSFKLSDYLEVYSFGPMEDNAINQYMMDLVLGNRQAALGNGTSMAKSAFDTSLATNDDLTAGEAHVVLIAITMPTTVDNVANHKTGVDAPEVVFGVNVNATQATYEKDSFDNQYDAGAEYEASKTPLPYIKSITVPTTGMQIVPDITAGFTGATAVSVTPEAAYMFVTTDDETTVQENPYKDWYVDFYVSADKAVAEGLILAGQYDKFSEYWYGFNVPAGEYTTPVPLLGQFCTGGVSNWTYQSIVNEVSTFQCAAANTGTANSGVTMTVELRLINPENTSEMITVSTTTYTFQ